MSEQSSPTFQEAPRTIAALLLALAAPALGGGTSLLAVLLLLAGIGAVAITLPARGVRPAFLVGAALLMLGTLGWAMPAAMVASSWRAWLLQAGLPVAWSNSPEPWTSARAWLVLPGALVWAGWCAGQVWTRRGRRVVCEGLAVGIGGIALVALLGRDGGVPGWPPGTGLGPFANRNQTATLFAIGAFLAVVCGVGRFRKWRAGAGPLAAWTLAWLGLLGVYTAALALNRSRSGPLLFAAMTLAWLPAAAPSWKRRPDWLAATVAVGLLMATVFLLTGRSVLLRLATTRLTDFRLKIYSDALSLIRASPWTGAGLGCFNVVFPMFRHASVLQERVLHPESDWLWLAAEAGLPGLLAMAGLAAWMAAQARRALADRPDRAIQLALCIASLGVMAHSLVDVPGHRLGTLMPALLLLGMAAAPEETGAPWPGRLLRCAAVPVLLIGLGGLAVLALRIPEPLVNGPVLLQAQAAREEAAGRPADAVATLGRALEWTPLDWRLYVERAQIEGDHGHLTAALGDFRRALFLEPDYAGLPFAEGIYWLRVAPPFAIAAWREALRRIPPEARPELFQNMLAHSWGYASLRSALWSLAAGDGRMQLVCFGWDDTAEFNAQIAEVLAADPALAGYDEDALRRLFAIWMQKGDARQLASLMEQRPAWLKAGYRALAVYDAANGDLPRAVALMERYLPPPRVPPPPVMTPEEAATRFAQDPGDAAAAMALYRASMAAGRDEDALATLRAMSNPPPYVHYLQAQILTKQQKPTEAWTELNQSPDPSPP